MKKSIMQATYIQSNRYSWFKSEFSSEKLTLINNWLNAVYLYKVNIYSNQELLALMSLF